MTATRDVGRRAGTVAAGPPVSASRDVGIGVPTGGRRRVRLPEIALGSLLIVGCALGALWWQARSYPTTSVLVASRDLDRGDVVSAESLAVVEMQARESVNWVASDQADLLIGRVAIASIGEGTVLTSSMVAESTDIGPDEAVVGLYLGPGQAPGTSLAPGATVDVVLTDPDSPAAGGAVALAAGTGDGTAPTDGPVDGRTAAVGSLLASSATVVDVQNGSGFGQILLSLRMSKSEAVVTAVAAAADDVMVLEVHAVDS